MTSIELRIHSHDLPHVNSFLCFISLFRMRKLKKKLAHQHLIPFPLMKLSFFPYQQSASTSRKVNKFYFKIHRKCRPIKRADSSYKMEWASCRGFQSNCNKTKFQWNLIYFWLYLNFLFLLCWITSHTRSKFFNFLPHAYLRTWLKWKFRKTLGTRSNREKLLAFLLFKAHLFGTEIYFHEHESFLFSMTTIMLHS